MAGGREVAGMVDTCLSLPGRFTVRRSLGLSLSVQSRGLCPLSTRPTVVPDRRSKRPGLCRSPDVGLGHFRLPLPSGGIDLPLAFARRSASWRSRLSDLTPPDAWPSMSPSWENAARFANLSARGAAADGCFVISFRSPGGALSTSIDSSMAPLNPLQTLRADSLETSDGARPFGTRRRPAERNATGATGGLQCPVCASCKPA